MTDYAMTLVGLAAALLLLTGLCRFFRLDEFGRLIDIPAEALMCRSMAIRRFLDAEIAPHVPEFEKKMEALGFKILDTELSVKGGTVGIRFDLCESSLIGKRDGVIYPSDDAEVIGSANREFIRGEIKKYFGDDPKFGTVGTLNGYIDYYTFGLVNPNFGGDVKRLLHGNFSVEYERLKKDYVDLEYCLVTGQLPEWLSFGRGF